MPDSPILRLTHRRDIQGLRAVAVLLVVLDHSGVAFLRGGYVGVDVFFVLSGFLITGILLSRAARDGSVSLSEFYARRARRILPAAVLTLVATDIAAHHLLNFVRARQAVSDSIWASLFSANIHFASQGSDYFTHLQPPSPVQHFWSLAVEEQFYLVWPAVLSLVLVGAITSRLRVQQVVTRSAVHRLLVVIVVAAIASLAWSVHSIGVRPNAAYFSTFARAWELALGAALAIAAPSLTRMSRSLRVIMGWMGLVGIASAGVLFSGSTPFPGYAALLPAAGAALVIGAGIRQQQPRLGVGRILSFAPLRYVGDRSYALYLWHWPVLVIAVQYAGHDLSLGLKLSLLFGAFVLSVISYRVFEHPIRQMSWPPPIAALLWPASTAVVVAVAVLTLGSIEQTAARIDAAAAAVRPAALVDPAAEASVTATSSKPLPAVVAAAKAARRAAPIPWPLTPAVGSLRGDFYNFPEGCTPGQGESSSKRICRLGDPTSVKTIVVMGDSHAQMWMPTILLVARWDGWVVVPFVKIGCVPRLWTRPKCAAWYAWVKRHIAELHPDVTLVADSWAATRGPGPDIRAVKAFSAAMKRFSATVIVVGDAPHQRFDPADCLLARHATMKTCTTKAGQTQLHADMTIASDARKSGVGFIDTRGWFCSRPAAAPVYFCPLVVNRTITCVDRDHISQTYGLELAHSFRTAFRRELFR
jgi:peptidoglycan/LPS O-acetylase OafA/YrhL